MNILKPIVGLAGVASNVAQGIRNWGLQSQAINQANQLQALASNPTAMAARIRAAQQPLSQGLVSDVTNQVQGQMAERGLALSPSIMNQVMGQALGPYQMQEQQLAMQSVMDPYQMAIAALQGAGRLTPPPANTAGLWGQFAPGAQTPQQPWPSGFENLPSAASQYNIGGTFAPQLPGSLPALLNPATTADQGFTSGTFDPYGNWVMGGS
jgi:hypothetical protein